MVRAEPTPLPGPGVDFALTVAGGALIPVALELNSGLCLEACGALEGLWAAPRSRLATEEAAAAAPLVETMLRRSARCLMEGKHLLVVGAGGVSKKFVWEAARDYGLKVGGARGGAKLGSESERSRRGPGQGWGGFGGGTSATRGGVCTGGQLGGGHLAQVRSQNSAACPVLSRSVLSGAQGRQDGGAGTAFRVSARTWALNARLRSLAGPVLQKGQGLPLRLNS